MVGQIQARQQSKSFIDYYTINLHNLNAQTYIC